MSLTESLYSIDEINKMLGVSIPLQMSYEWINWLSRISGDINRLQPQIASTVKRSIRDHYDSWLELEEK